VLRLSYSMLTYLTISLILDLFQIGDVVTRFILTVADKDGSLQLVNVTELTHQLRGPHQLHGSQAEASVG
jgi:hypothetical protein